LSIQKKFTKKKAILLEEVHNLQRTAETRTAEAKAAAEAEQQGLGGVVMDGNINMEIAGGGLP
jgi:hypothetical protein